jgi:Cu/Ag efflux protein CusF
VLKVRILRIDEVRGEFRADVAGHQDSFRMDNPRALRRYAEGDMVIVTLESRRGEELVTDIQPAAQKGEVRRIDGRRGEIAIDVNGRVETYRVSNKRLLDGIRVGDRIRFEFEDRPGSDVITAIY